MPSTTRFALRYPSTSDTPNGAAQIQSLATDVETALTTLDDAQGWVAESVRTTSIGSVSTVETVLDSVTFTASAARRYKVSAMFSYQSSVVGDVGQVRMRWKAGTTLGIDGTEFHSGLFVAETVDKGNPAALVRTITGLSGSITIGTTAIRVAGTGLLNFFGGASQNNFLLVEAIG